MWRATAHAEDTTAGSYSLEAAMCVEMVEGDLMYVPPFWAHAVLSTGAESSEGDAATRGDEGGHAAHGASCAAGGEASPSLSLSVVAPSWVEMMGKLLKAVPLPFGQPFARPGAPGSAPPDDVTADEVHARAAAVGRFLRALFAPSEVRGFAHSLYHERHAPITAEDAEVAQRSLPASCPASWRLPADLAEPALADAARAVHAALARRDAQPQQHFDTLDCAGTCTEREGLDLRRHLLADYVDLLAAWAVGEDAAGGLVHCWAQPMAQPSANRLPTSS